jgi:CRP-like cAMP-binding protein
MPKSITLPNHILDPILKHVGEKIHLSPAENDYFSSLLQYKKFPRKSKILSPGEVGRNQYFVIKGCLRIFYLDQDGLEHNAKFAVENWWAFDIQSFFESTPAYYGISCLEDTAVLLLSYDNHAELVKHIPRFERFYRLMMQQSFIALQHRMTQSLSLTAEEQYLHFQQKYPGLEARIPQKQIASYLGITPVFLSMLRKQELIKR